MCVLHRCDEHTNLDDAQLRLITIAVARSRGKEIILDSDPGEERVAYFLVCVRFFGKTRKTKKNL